MLPSRGCPLGPGASLGVVTATELYPQEELDGGGELLDLLVGVLALLYRRPDAVLDVVLEEDGAHLLERRNDAGDLGEDVHAIGLLVHHPLYPADLAFDPPEAVLEELLVLRLYVAVHGFLLRLLVSLGRVHLSSLSLVDLHPPEPEGVAHHRHARERHRRRREHGVEEPVLAEEGSQRDRKSTRLNSSHANISYAVFCLKKKKNPNITLL